jgi:hypothetical protein
MVSVDPAVGRDAHIGNERANRRDSLGDSRWNRLVLRDSPLDRATPRLRRSHLWSAEERIAALIRIPRARPSECQVGANKVPKGRFTCGEKNAKVHHCAPNGD